MRGDSVRTRVEIRMRFGLRLGLVALHVAACRPRSVQPGVPTPIATTAPTRELGRLRVFQHVQPAIRPTNSGYVMRELHLAVASQDTGRKIVDGRFALTGIELRVPVGEYVIEAWSLEYPDDIAYDQGGNRSPPEARHDCNDLVVRVASDAPVEVVTTRRGDDCVSALGAAAWTVVFGRGEVTRDAAQPWWLAFHLANKRSPALTVVLPREVMAAYVHVHPRDNGTFAELRVSASGSVPDEDARVCSLFESGCRELLAATRCMVTFTPEELASGAATGRRMSVVVPGDARGVGEEGASLPTCAWLEVDRPGGSLGARGSHGEP